MTAIEEVEARAPEALGVAANALPEAFPQAIVDAVSKAVMERLPGLRPPDTE